MCGEACCLQLGFKRNENLLRNQNEGWHSQEEARSIRSDENCKESKRHSIQKQYNHAVLKLLLKENKQSKYFAKIKIIKQNWTSTELSYLLFGKFWWLFSTIYSWRRPILSFFQHFLDFWDPEAGKATRIPSLLNYNIYTWGLRLYTWCYYIFWDFAMLDQIFISPQIGLTDYQTT